MWDCARINQKEGEPMKKLRFLTTSFTAFFLVLVLSSSSSAESPDLDRRIWEAKKVLSEIMAAPDQSIPEEMLAKCKAIAVYPNVLKGAFIFGGRWGQGVVLKRDERSGKWGPVAFSTIGGGSWGFQIGGQMTDLILVILNDRGLDGLLSNNFTLGGDAAAVAGPVGRSSELSTDLTLRAGIVSYSRARGLFAGIALDGAILTQDNHSNSNYYGRAMTSRDILLNNAVSIQLSSKELVDALDEYSTRWDKRLKRKR